MSYSDEQLQIKNQQNKIQTNVQEMSGHNQSGLNAIYANLTKQLTCDSECQKREQIDELRKTWKAAKISESNAPTVTLNAEKNYLIAYEGIDGYNNTMFTRYSGVANAAKEQAMKSHSDTMNDIVTLNNDYTAETKSLEHIKELLRIKLRKNEKLQKMIDQQIASVETNDRKVVYEDWAKNWLDTVKKALFWTYIVTVFIFIYKSSFISDSKWKTFSGWLIPVASIIFPFVVYYIALLIIFLYNKILWFMENKSPKDVYARL